MIKVNFYDKVSDELLNSELPSNWTYPEIQPLLLEKVTDFID